MLFHVTWSSEDGVRRSLSVFGGWQPPPAPSSTASTASRAAEGVVIIEVDSAATLNRVTAPWGPWLRFTVNPIVPIEESAAIAGEGVAFRDSVG